ncbi:hypothetical protein [Peterkaempfera griseoplana]|uniref:hypothetical protein n=1 Tax=Peterkaempfera griseoplana TaxID=66896 RepID=UPI0006E26C28|nr:hypothetical protein [Peterkaempfera griseoplana]
MSQDQGAGDAFRSDVAPPPRPRPTAAQLCGRTAFGIAVISGLVTSVVLGTPALQAGEAGHTGTGAGHAAADAAGR